MNCFKVERMVQTAIQIHVLRYRSGVSHEKEQNRSLLSYKSSQNTLLVLWFGFLRFIKCRVHVSFLEEKTQESIPRQSHPIEFTGKLNKIMDLSMGITSKGIYGKFIFGFGREIKEKSQKEYSSPQFLEACYGSSPGN